MMKFVALTTVACAAASVACTRGGSVSSPDPVIPGREPGGHTVAAVYGSPSPSDYPLHPWTLSSRVVLYEDGTFALQYTAPASEYRGTYTSANGTFTFAWEGASVAGPWGASAENHGGLLALRFNEVMQLSDFENAVYHREP